MSICVTNEKYQSICLFNLVTNLFIYGMTVTNIPCNSKITKHKFLKCKAYMSTSFKIPLKLNL